MDKSELLASEHWRLNNKGQLAGVWHINAEKAEGVDIWQKIDRVINEYTKIHPNEMRMLVLENKFISDTRKNDYASSGGTAKLRWGASIPPGLFFKLQIIEPTLFENRRLFNRFLKRYKGLRICKKV